MNWRQRHPRDRGDDHEIVVRHAGSFLQKVVNRGNDVVSSLTPVRDGVKQKTGCRFPWAEYGVHGPSRRGRKAALTQQWTSSGLRNAVPR